MMGKMFKVNPGSKIRGIQETIYFYDPEYDLEAGDEFEVIYESIDSSFKVDGYYIQVISGNFQNEQMIIEPEDLSSVKVTEILKEENPLFVEYEDGYLDGYLDGYNNDGYPDGYNN